MPHIKQPEETMIARDNQDSHCKPRQMLKCEFGMHDWKTTKMVKYCPCCRKRKWRPLDEDGNYHSQTFHGIWTIRYRVRTTNDEEPENSGMFMTESFIHMLYRTWRLIRAWGAYQIEITWSPL